MSGEWIGAAAVTAVVAYAYTRMRARTKRRDGSEGSMPPPLPAEMGPTSSSRGSRQGLWRALRDDEPHDVGSIGSPTKGFKVPAAPKGFGAATWVPAGTSISVGKITIPGGMIYVGRKLQSRYGEPDPCLIDPTKSIAKSGDYTTNRMGYWPNYSAISSQERRAYLNWLAGGRVDPAADIGYVFLFFYGLERRIIVDGSRDAAARAEWPVIEAELRRLLDIYGESSHSFRRYCIGLLSWITLADHPPKLYEQPVPPFPRTFELPFYVRLALGQAAVDGVPVPAHLALAWARLDPNVSLRTPAKRCAPEFAKLFEETYTKQHGGGLVLPRNRTKLKFVYGPASSGLAISGEVKLTFDGIPDVTVLTAPLKKLQATVEAATQPLDSFSRLLGRNPKAGSSIEAALLLPATLWPKAVLANAESIKAGMEDGMASMSFQYLLDSLGATSTFTKSKTVALTGALETLCIGFEPDVAHGAKTPKPDDQVILFELPVGPPELGSRENGAYAAAALTLDLASAVASTDGDFSDDEASHLRDTIVRWSHLPARQVRRLLAHLALLRIQPKSLTSLKKKLEPLELGTRETLAKFMATVVNSDGVVSPAEVKLLEKVYKALGVDPARVFSDVHAAGTGGTAGATSATTPASTKRTKGTELKLDPARIAALQEDTKKVSALLAEIFVEPDEAAPPVETVPEVAEDEPEDTEPTSSILGLDEAHSALARLILTRPEWTREELLDTAGDLELMLDGALEQINESALDTFDVPFLEGDDPVTINPEILEKLEP